MEIKTGEKALGSNKKQEKLKDYEQWRCDKLYADLSKNYSTNV
jgi:hypothetical protein